MKVKILNLEQFKYLISQDIRKEYCYISILDPDDKKSLAKDSNNYKTFWFYDLENDVSTYKAFSPDQAESMINFIDNNKDCKKFIVHCTAGVSRSGAVGEYIHELFGGSYQELMSENKNILPSGRVLMYLRYAQKYKEDKTILF